jgi:beta-barrel assembly-enhancing protease
MRNLLRGKLTPAGALFASFLVLASGSTLAANGQSSTPPSTPSSTPPPNPSAAPSSNPSSTQEPTPSSTPPPNPSAAQPPNPSSSTDSTQNASDAKMPHVKPGSIDDVNAVGTRDIGGRGMGNWYSTESEIKMGKSYAAELEKSVKFVNDPVVNEYVNRVGQNLVKNSDAKVPFTIKIIDSDEVNAMALPGGFFYVNSGLILTADDEAEMAGVMAHEIAHVAAHHAAREQTRMNYAQLGTIPLIFIGGWTGYGIYEAANIGIPLTFLQFSREFESQADFLGVEYMYRAGYDPQAFITIFEKLQNLEKTKPGMLAKAFATHPQTPNRIEATQKEIATILPPRDEYVVTTSEFDDVKARLARIENKRKLKDGESNRQPTLRRASSSKPDSSDPNSSQGNDRPTLQRRDDN